MKISFRPNIEEQPSLYPAKGIVNDAVVNHGTRPLFRILEHVSRKPDVPRRNATIYGVDCIETNLSKHARNLYTKRELRYVLSKRNMTELENFRQNLESVSCKYYKKVRWIYFFFFSW